MAKTLILARHAQTNFSGLGQADEERHLTGKGIVDAERMGAVLKNEGYIPEVIYSSKVKRSHQTADIFAIELDYPQENILELEELYHTTAEHLLSFIHSLSDEYQNVMMFSHNSELSSLITRLIGKESDLVNPCTVVILRSEVSTWKDLSSCTLVDIKHPEEDHY